jgi:transposase
MKAYSEDLRLRIVHAVETGMPRAAVAELFMVSEHTIKRYLRQWRTTQTLAPGVSPGRPRRIAPTDDARVQAQLTEAPDATLAMHCVRWEGATGVAISRSTWCRMRRRIGWTHKKVADRQRAGRGGSRGVAGDDGDGACRATGVRG